MVRMETRITSSPRVAASFIKEGRIVAFPTETVFGLGADALNARAVKSIFKAKGRPSDNPLIVHIGDYYQLSTVARRVPPTAEKLIGHFFPGPLTVIVPRHPDVPLEVTAGLDTVGVRFPAHPLAQLFLRECDTPVAAPSANRSGRPSPTSWHAVFEEMNGRIPCILKGGSSRVGLESTVVDCTRGRPVILREGAVTLEMIREVLPGVISARGVSDATSPARSPGTKYRHYAPVPKVVLVDGPDEVVGMRRVKIGFIGTASRGFRTKPDLLTACRGVRTYAQKLFRFFRACERSGVQVIYCQRVPARGLGRALMDRLQKAAGDPSTGS